MVKVDLWLPPLYLAEIVTDLVALTGAVVIAKLADTMFAGIVSVEGTVAKSLLLLLKVTAAPSGGAGLFRVTVPVACVPRLTEVGLTVMEASAAAVTVKLAFLVIVA